MIRKPMTFSRILMLVLVAGFVSVAASALYAANAGDREIQWAREVPSKCKAEDLRAGLDDLKRWPEWFKALDRVESPEGIVLSGAPQVGSRLVLQINPKRSPWSRFNLTVKVLEFEPGKAIRLELLDDSTGRLPQLFSRLEWKVELAEGSRGPVIRGSEVAQTRHWRSRVFGRLAERTLMNQVYYPDLIKFSELTLPKEPTFEFMPRGGGR